MHLIEAQIAVCHLAVRLARIRRLVNKLVEQRAMKMPNLQAVGPELAKLQSEIEDEARKFIDGIAATRARKQNTFDHARKQVAAADAALSDINALLDELDKATNGPPSPTSGGSPGSPVGAQPSETATLGDVKAG
jgi:uncharacterized protein involved in exopolysaccharide biosynthesis